MVIFKIVVATLVIVTGFLQFALTHWWRDRRTRRYRLARRVALGVLIVSGSAGVFLLIFEQNLSKREQMKTARAGVLKPQSAREAAIALNQVYFRTAGTSSFASLFDFLQYAPPEFRRIAEENRFVAEIVDGRLYVSGQFIAPEGMLLRIERNEWRISPSVWDRNYNNNALEVVDENHTVVLQFHLVNGTPKFQGRVYARNGEKLWIKDGEHGSAQMYFTTNSGIPCVINTQKYVLAGSAKPELVACDPYTHCFDVKPLFRYPSELHFGENAP